MGLLKRLSRSRSSEKVSNKTTYKNDTNISKDADSMLGRLPKFRSKSKNAEFTSRTNSKSNTETSSPNSTWQLQSMNRTINPFEQQPGSRPATSLSSDLQSQASFRAHSMTPSRSWEHRPESTYENHPLHPNSTPGSRPSLPPAPAPPGKPESKSRRSVSPRGKKNNRDAEKFEKPTIIEIPRIICRKCKQPCTVEALKINELFYHPDCFVCDVCNVILSNSTYFAKDGGVYCTKDFNALFGTKCRACKNYIQGDVVAVLGFTYHPTCFNCSRCGKLFEAGQEVVIDKDETYCENCPALKQNPAVVFCTGCRKVIFDTTNSLCALDGNWHPECLKCFTCQTMLRKGLAATCNLYILVPIIL